MKTLGVDCRCRWYNQVNIRTNVRNRMGCRLCKTKVGRATVNYATYTRIQGLHVSFDISYMWFHHEIIFSSRRSFIEEIPNVRDNGQLQGRHRKPRRLKLDGGHVFDTSDESYAYWTVHHLDSWVKRDQLDATCFIITLSSTQHVSDVNTSILRSLRLIRRVTSWVVSVSETQTSRYRINAATP